MSTTGSPSHRGNVAAFDGSTFYDPDFTVEISNRMRVPDKISVLNDSDLLNQPDQRDRLTGNSKGKGSNDWMRVPERILVAGNDKHVAGIQPLPELRIESSIRGEDQYAADVGNTIQMMTPPRVLSLSDHAYPSVQDEDDDTIAMRKSNTGTSASSGKKGPESWNMTMNESPNDVYNNSITGLDVGDVNVVRRQLKILNRRLTHLEQENNMRYQRELIIYSLGILYFVMKGVSWFNRKAW